MERRPFTIWIVLDVDPRYEVSHKGVIRRRTRGPGTWVGREFKGAQRADGYLQLFKIGPFNMAHQAIAHAFLGPRPEGMIPNHKNGIRDDNRWVNLEYVTHQENILHGRRELTPHRSEHRRKVNQQNVQRMIASNRESNHSALRYTRSAETREKLRQASLGQPPWWVKRGFTSLRDALQSRKLP